MAGSTPDYGTILLDGVAFPLPPGAKMQPSAVDRFPGKVTIGDYSLDTNDLISSWVLSDLTGGHGITDLKEGVDDTRYRFGTIYTRYASGWTKPFKITRDSMAVGASVMVLGDMFYAGDWYQFISAGSSLYRGTTVAPTAPTVAIGTITGTPSDKSKVYGGTNTQPILYIPQGSNGYSAYNIVGPVLRNVSAAEKMVSFLVWDDKLIGIDTAGQIYKATAGTAAANTVFTSYGVGGKLDPSFVPKKLLAYYNQGRELTIYVVTDRGVWSFDPATPRLYQIPDFEGEHPKFGLASAIWRGNMYVSAGMDILEFNGNVVRNIGLSRDDGLPYDYQGWVVDMVPGQNGLYALVQGRTSGGTTYHSVQEFSVYGWHTIDVLGGITGTPTSINITRGGGRYDLGWGTTSGLYTYQNLPVSFTNPREAVDSAGFSFGAVAGGASAVFTTTFYLETPWFDANMRGYTKIANALEINIRTMPTSHTISIEYQKNFDTAWTVLTSTIATTGKSIIPFGTLNDDGLYPGMSFDRIKFRYSIVETATSLTTTPTIESVVFSFLKIMNPSWSWTVQVDLTSGYGLYSPEQMLDKLVALKDSGGFFSMKHRDDIYRIRIAGISGSEDTGLDKRNIYQLSLLEIPLQSGAPVAPFAHRDTQSATGANTATVTKPTGTTNGDLLVAAVHDTFDLPSAPVGWTLATSNTSYSGNGKAAIYYKVASGEGASFSFIGSGFVDATVSCFSGSPKTSPLDVAGAQANASSVNCVAPSITTTAAGDLLFFMGAENGTAVSHTPPTGFTEPTNGEIGRIGVSYLLSTTLGAQGTKTATLSTAQANAGLIAAFRGA